MNAASAVFHEMRSLTSAVRGSTRDLTTRSGSFQRTYSMARIQRLIPTLFMAFTLFLGTIGLVIVDVSAVRAASATEASAVEANLAPDTYTLSSANGSPVSVPGYPY
jgi:hypothetical protein